jgi:succinate dehydrogenase / fumarate reductase cytochrome b subunit
MKRTYAYFPGCSAKGTCSELDTSTHAVAALFDIALIELENPGCTGAREFRAKSEELHLTANGRILALAERNGCDLVAVCDTCLLNLTETNQRLKADEEARDMVNRALAGEGLKFEGKIEVKHFLWVLTEDVGEEGLRERVVLPLRGLKAAPFYGCHIQRPKSVYGEETAEAPALDRLIKVLGGEVVDYEGANKCCGFHVVGVDPKIAVRMSGGHLRNAVKGGAQCVVTPCPLCHTVFDGYQPSMAPEHRGPQGAPVLHVSQLVGLAMGLSAEALALSRHVVGCDEILAHIGYAEGARVAATAA